MKRLLLAATLATPFAVAGTLPACLPEAPKFTPMTVETPADMTAQTIDGELRLSARAYFTQKVLPLITPTCSGCHKTDGGVGPAFLKSGSTETYDPYPITRNWNNFVVPNPELSQLLKKGMHEGPALTLDQNDTVLTWLNLEKQESDATNISPFKPQTKPFYPTVTANTPTKVDLGAIDAQFTGAYVSFQATEIKLNGLTRGIELSNLAVFNVKPGAKTGDQRTIRFKRPLFILWQGSQATPDPIDNFANTDMSVLLDTTATPPGTSIVPGRMTLSAYRPGMALSLSFDILQLLAPAAGSNPCKPAGLTAFTTGVKSYLAGPKSCTNFAGNCHAGASGAGGVNMDAAFLPNNDPKVATLCEVLKFYQNNGVLADNTDPSKTRNHPYKWTDGNCTANAFPAGCFATFNNNLKSWQTAEQ